VLTLPAPTGPFPVGTASARLVDHSRRDSLRPGRAYRELMVSVWYPSREGANGPLAPQMAPAAAKDFDRRTAPELGVPSGMVDWAATRTHAVASAPPLASAAKDPVLLYSPGLDGPRTLGTSQVEDLASRGYVVFAVDHTYEPDQVEFPGGRVERGRLPDVRTAAQADRLIAKLLATRVADLRFTVDTVRHRWPRAFPSTLPAALDFSRVGAFGHSFGGATAAELMRVDRRVDAGVDLDGTMVGPVVRTGLRKPFLIVSGQESSRKAVPGWAAFWKHSTGWKRELRLEGSEHLSFMDTQAMLPQLGAVAGPFEELIGTIDPARSIVAQRTALAAFFDLHLRGQSTSLFDHASEAAPELQPVP
jgi:dienelactone hydrolase